MNAAGHVDLTEETAGRVKVGDTVLVRGTVLRVIPDTGVLVEMFSQIGLYEAWVRLDRVAVLVVPDVPDEPEDGTWLNGYVGGDDNGSVFRRDDAEGHTDPDRRWWDFAAGQWIDWPTAVSRGADPTRRLYSTPSVGVPELPAVTPDMINAVGTFLRRCRRGTPAQIRAGAQEELRGVGLDTEISVEQTERVLGMLCNAGRARVGDVVGGFVVQWSHAEARD